VRDGSKYVAGDQDEAPVASSPGTLPSDERKVSKPIPIALPPAKLKLPKS
jgi:hypothetical protein